MSASRPQAAPSTSLAPPLPGTGSAEDPAAAPAVHDLPDRLPPAIRAAGPGAKPPVPGGGGGGGAASGGGNPRGAPPAGVYGILHVIGGNDRGKQCELSRQ